MQAIKHRQSGRSLLTTIFLIPALLIGSALAYFVFCEARKAYWDHQVKLMCEKDGGVKVYEKIVLTESELAKLLNEYGQLVTPIKAYAKFADPFFIEQKDVPIRTARPRVSKSEYDLYRAVDKKLIASAITYRRKGGDFPTWAHDSSFSCIDFKGPDFLSFEESVFDVQGK